MAIIFTTDISESNLLFAFNNNIVRFSSDQDITPLYCDIIGLGMEVKIYSSPNNSFYFNLKEYVSSYVNSNRFEDAVNPDLVSADPETFIYDAEIGNFKSGPVTFIITFIDETTDIIVKNLNFLAGVIQLEDFKKQQIPINANYAILSPVNIRSNNSTYLKYWEGYPFEFSFYTSKVNLPFALKNSSNGLEQEFTPAVKVNSLYLSDGRTDVTLEDFLPLIVGFNTLNIIQNGVNQGVNIFLEKAGSDCGIYIKWRNHLGRYNYWLLDKNSKRDRGFKNGPEIENDFSNIDETFSPTIQTGKDAQDLLRCIAKKIPEHEKEILIGLFESPKIYLFTGERFSRSSNNDWVEVRLNNTSSNISDSNKKLHTFQIDLQLPPRYTQSL